MFEDTGKKIKGNRIDVYFNSHTEAVNWGTQEVEVTVYYVKDKKHGEIFAKEK